MSELRSQPPADGWRGDARAVVLITFDFDAEAPILAEGEHYAEDLSTMSHQAYGPKIGVPRILDLLARHEVEATFFVPGVTAERWPGPVEKILEAGHEVALHGHSHRRLPRLSQDEQVADLELGLGALARLGVSPKGYRAPYWQLTQTTLDALPQHGIRYDSSLMDDDRPYRIAISEREIAELPVHWSLDDWEQYAFLPDPDIGQRIENPRDVAEIWKGELDAMRQTGSLCVLTCHPFLSGRPSRMRAIEDFVNFAKECGDVRFSRADRLSEIVLQDMEEGD